jgi:uncharacterized peroxidase-related enzyme
MKHKELATMDVIDQAAGLSEGSALHGLRRVRPLVVQATQASHDALLDEASPGWGRHDRLQVAVAVCEAAGAQALGQHYQRLAMQADAAGMSASAAALKAAIDWAVLLTSDPRLGDQAAVQSLRAQGMADAAIVALGQLVGFLSYQIRVVAGLRALRVESGAAPTGDGVRSSAISDAPPYDPQRTVQLNGYTNQTLGWRSWLQPLAIDEATALQLEVLDESHAQARVSEYYRTLVHQPLMLRHRSAAYNTIMYGTGGAPRAERELAAMAVSVANGCVYCTSVHAQRYAQLARRHDSVEQVFAAEPSAGATQREQAVVQMARALTRDPQAASDAWQGLAAAGLSTAEQLDVLHAAAIFGWANRLMHNLGEPVPPVLA